MPFVRLCSATCGIVLLLMSLFLLIARQQTPQPPWIAYITNANSHPEIWQMRSDGTHHRRLSDYLYLRLPIQWSPDGKQLAFSVAIDRYYGYELFVMPSVGGTPRKITYMVGDEYSSEWSPDGQWLAFINHGQFSDTLYVIRPDDTNSLQSVITAESLYSPAWSPDGQWLAYTKLSNVGDITELYGVRRDGSDASRLIDIPKPQYNPSWSPDGQWILFSIHQDIHDDPLNSDLYRVKPDGTSVQQLTHTSDTRESQASWAPDGQWILFITEKDLDNNNYVERDIYRVKPDGSNLQELPNIPDQIEDQVSWSRDGQWILFTRTPSLDKSRIFKMHPDGSQLAQLTPTTANGSFPVWSPIIDLPLRFGWLVASGVLLVVNLGLWKGINQWKPFKLKQSINSTDM